MYEVQPQVMGHVFAIVSKDTYNLEMLEQCTLVTFMLGDMCLDLDVFHNIIFLV